MPPAARRPAPARRPAAPPARPATAQQSVRRGLRVDDGILQFEFKPSVGISARAIDKMGVDIRSFREPLKRVVQQVMAPSFLKNFDQGGRPDAWTPLSEATLELKAARGHGSRIMIATGALRRVTGQLNLWTITTETATIRSLPDKVSYGGIHQQGYGGKGGGSKMKARLKAAGGDAKAALRDLDDDLIMAMRTGKKLSAGGAVSEIPARPFVVIQDEDYDKIEEVFVEWLTERMRVAGFMKGPV
jgi:phage gpG-like protein